MYIKSQEKVVLLTGGWSQDEATSHITWLTPESHECSTVFNKKLSISRADLRAADTRSIHILSVIIYLWIQFLLSRYAMPAAASTEKRTSCFVFNSSFFFLRKDRKSPPVRTAVGHTNWPTKLNKLAKITEFESSVGSV